MTDTLAVDVLQCSACAHTRLIVHKKLNLCAVCADLVLPAVVRSVYECSQESSFIKYADVALPATLLGMSKFVFDVQRPKSVCGAPRRCGR